MGPTGPSFAIEFLPSKKFEKTKFPQDLCFLTFLYFSHLAQKIYFFQLKYVKNLQAFNQNHAAEMGKVNLKLSVTYR